MLRFYLLSLITLCCFCYPSITNAQDVEQTLNTVKTRIKDPVKVSGGLAFGLQFSDISGAPARFDGFDWNFRAQLTLDVLGVQAPFSAIISDRNRLYNLPSYQFLGFSPRYKWATLHAGDRSMNFNQYTFSNQLFRGVGLELTPGKWRFAGMRGRLNRLQLGDFNARQDLEISYRRMGWAAEAGYAEEVFDVKFILFGAEDQLAGVMDSLTLSGLAPARNLVGSVEAGVELLPNLTLRSTFAHSWITDNTLAAGVPDSMANSFINANASTSRETAFNSSLNFSLPKSNWQLTYERISPNYRSLGTLFITPDRENVTLGSAFTLGEGKATLSLSGGLQRTNLADKRTNTQRRIIAQVAGSVKLSDQLSASANLSNFLNTTRLRSFFDPLSSTDSIFLAQVNSSGRIGLRWQRPKDKPQGSWNLDLSVQDARSIQDDVLTDFSSRTYNLFFGYAAQAPGSRLTYRAQILLGMTDAGALDNTIISPSIGLSRSFKDDKLVLGLTSSYSFVDYATRGPGGVWLSRLTGGLPLLTNGRLQAYLQYTRRNLGEASFSEIIAALNYNWNF
ncbi:MAG: hypothetical protein AAF840_11705 [Bacteroidota bacterium]